MQRAAKINGNPKNCKTAKEIILWHLWIGNYVNSNLTHDIELQSSYSQKATKQDKNMHNNEHVIKGNQQKVPLCG